MIGAGTHADAGQPGHMLPLDGLRGIAILIVLVYHGLSFSNFSANTRFDEGVARVTMFGWTGVDLFFVLSGFLITGILLDNRARSGAFVSFYGRRFLRIVPLYFAFLGVLMFILPLFAQLRSNTDLQLLRNNQAWYWTFTLNLKVVLEPLESLGRFGNGHLWSLMVEEQFYVIWPFIVLLLPRRALLPTFLTCVAAAPLIRYGMLAGAFPRIHNIFSPQLLMPARMDTLAVGAVIAYALRDARTWSAIARIRPWIGLAAITAIGLITAYYQQFWIGDRWTMLAGFSAIALLYGCVVSLAATARPGSLAESLLTHGTLRMFARYSYALYVVHFQIMQEVARQWEDQMLLGSHFPSRLLFASITIAISMSVAWLSWHLLEQPILSLKRYMAIHTPAAASEKPA